MKETLYRLHDRKKILKDFYVFDTETIERKKDKIRYTLRGRPENFAFGVVYGYNFTKIIYTVEDFKKEFLDPRYKNKKIFAHQATYDLGTIYGDIFTLDNESIFNGSQFICCSNGNATFCDSLNIFRTSVEKLGETIGRKKLKISYKWKNGISKNDINYCIRDCEIIYDALAEIFNEVGDIKITQASLSMNFFRRYYMPFNITKNKEVENFWESYFGGRTEAFKLGKTHANVIDVNSMYPFIMKTIKFPNPRSLKKVYDISVKQFTSRIIKEFEGCIKCSVVHEETYIGYLPVKKDGKLIFPIGEFSGCWNFNELNFAIEQKVVKIKSIEWVVYSEGMDSIFKTYITDLYRKRITSNNDFEKFRIKIFMNSLYGKFAQRVKEDEIYLSNVDEQYQQVIEAQKNGRFKKLRIFNETRSDGFLILKAEKIRGLAHSIPSFSSYITSASRILLLKKMIEMEKNKLVYCDTDSIFFEIMPHNFSSSEKIGEWKLENKIVTEIKGLKNYKYISEGKEKRKLKGVPEKAVEISENVFKFTNLVKAKEGLVRNLDMNIPIDRQKIITNKYDKRIVENYETKPIKLN
jgi:hypothetical protein